MPDAPLSVEQKRPVGRPSIRTEENAERICNLLIEGLSLRKICAREDMPSITAVIEWLTADDKFAAQYAYSRERQAEILADEIVDIADDSSNDTQTDDDGNKVVNYDVVQRSRLRVEARKWVASKLLPKKYGERANETHVTTAINNFLVITEEKAAQLQERRKKMLEG